jgi:hypothetical protein
MNFGNSASKLIEHFIIAGVFLSVEHDSLQEQA